MPRSKLSEHLLITNNCTTAVQLDGKLANWWSDIEGDMAGWMEVAVLIILGTDFFFRKPANVQRKGFDCDTIFTRI